MKSFFLLTAFSAASFFFSCGTHSKAVIEKSVAQFADLECEAIQLRKQRFSLADEIRYTEDTLQRAPNETATAELRQKLALLNTQKLQLTNDSRAMAERIKEHIDSLMASVLKTGEEKEAFNTELTKVLKQKNCL
jgi:hypothetical protein